MSLCGQNERLPHLTGRGNFPEAMPAHHVEGATPTIDRTSGRDNKGSGKPDVCVDLSMWVNLYLAIKIKLQQIFFAMFKDRNVVFRSSRRGGLPTFSSIGS